jgi:hypothetical protein
VVTPLIYGFLSGKEEYILLTAGTFLGGLVILFAYLGVIAYISAKKENRRYFKRWKRMDRKHYCIFILDRVSAIVFTAWKNPLLIRI